MLLIFDVDGVLVASSWDALYETYQKIILSLGRHHEFFFKDVEEFKKWWNPNWKWNEWRIGIRNKEDREKSHKFFYETVAPRIYLISSWEFVLKALVKNHKLAILTNRHRYNAMEQLGPIAPYFEVIIGAEDIKKLKPDPEGIEIILGKIKMPREKAIMIGDRPEDIEAGKSAKIKTAAMVWKYGLGQEEDFKGLNPDYILRSPLHLIKLIKKT